MRFTFLLFSICLLLFFAENRQALADADNNKINKIAHKIKFLKNSSLCQIEESNSLEFINITGDDLFKISVQETILSACRNQIISVDFRSNGICKTRRQITTDELDIFKEILFNFSNQREEKFSYAFRCIDFGDHDLAFFYSEFGRKVKAAIDYVYLEDIKIKEFSIVGKVFGNNFRIHDSDIGKLLVYQSDFRGNIIINNSRFEEVEIGRSIIANDLYFGIVDINKKMILGDLTIKGNFRTGSDENQRHGDEISSAIETYFNKYFLHVRGNFVSNGLNISGDMTLVNSMIDVDVFEAKSARARSLLFHNIKIYSNNLNMQFNEIKETFSINDSVIKGTMNLNGLEARSLKLGGSRFSQDLLITECKVSLVSIDQYSSISPAFAAGTMLAHTINSVVDGTLSFQACNLGFIFVANSEIGRLLCLGCEVTSSVSLAAKFKDYVDLSASKFGGNLYLYDTSWTSSSSFILIGLKTPQIHAEYKDVTYGIDGQNRKFVRTLFHGIDFQYIGSRAAGEKGYTDRPDGIDDLPSEKIIEWLQSGQNSKIKQRFDPYPYIVMANALKLAGYRDKSNDLNAFRVKNTLEGSSNLMDTVKSWIGHQIGYGYKLDFAIIILFCVFAFGAIIWGGNKYLLHERDGTWQRLTHMRKISCMTEIFLSSFFESFVRLSPNIANQYSDTIVYSGKNVKYWRKTFSSYWIAHTFIGSIGIFLLLTPIVGFFD